MKILLMLHLREGPVQTLAAEFPDVAFVWAESADAVRREVADADALVVSGTVYSRELASLAQALGKKLRWVQSRSVGVDKFAALGIPDGCVFTNARGINGRTESEHAIALLLALGRRLPEMERRRIAAEWRAKELRQRTVSLEGRAVGIVGYGTIGRQVARKARAFDARIIAVTRTGEPVEGADETVAVACLDSVLPRLDALVLAVPLTRETYHLIGARELSLMKPTAFLINVARGKLVDQKALVQALREGRVAGAGLDVFEEEPLPADDPLWRLENVIISHHIAGSGGDAPRRFAELVAENLRRFRDGRPLLNRVELASVAL